jgi:hypothetical protein
MINFVYITVGCSFNSVSGKCKAVACSGYAGDEANCNDNSNNGILGGIKNNK